MLHPCKVTFKNYFGSAVCYQYGYRNKILLLNDPFPLLNATFLGGHVYGILALHDRCAWGLSWAIGGRATTTNAPFRGRIFISDVEVNERKLRENACFVGENPYLFGLRRFFVRTTPKKIITKEIERHHLALSPEDVRVAFDLSGERERFNRDMRYVGSEINQITMAIGYVKQKKIFCYPWVTYSDAAYLRRWKPYFDALARAGAMVLVPSNNEKMLRQVCTKIVRWTHDEDPDNGGMIIEDA